MAEFTPQEIEQFLQQFFDVVGARQYVGARYVPIFGRAGEVTMEWDNGAPYEPLTVVMHDGVSYVSRRYVPSGIDIANTGYWVETYRFNAQVEQYRQEVLTFQGQIDDIRDDYAPLPNPVMYPKYGEPGQVMSTLGDGSTRWVDPVTPSDEQAEAVITEWLADHPEATTTVQDGAVTTPKLANGAVTGAKIADGTIGDSKLDEFGVLADVADANQALGRTDVNVLDGLSWELGSITSSGTNTSSGNTIRTRGYATLTGATVIRFDIDQGYMFGWHLYDENHVHVSSATSYAQASIDIQVPDNARYLRINMAKSGETQGNVGWSSHLTAEMASFGLVDSVDSTIDELGILERALGVTDVSLLSGMIWEVGSINGSGTNTSGGNVIRTVGYASIPPTQTLAFDIDQGYMFGWHLYDEDHVHLASATSYISASTEIPVPENAHYLRVNLAKSGETTASLEWSEHLSATCRASETLHDVNVLTDSLGTGTLWYDGERLSLAMAPSRYKYDIDVYVDYNSTDFPNVGAYELTHNQSMAIFGDYIFLCGHGGRFAVMDFATGAHVDSFVSPVTAHNHHNSAQFSDYYYAEGDEFPLLFVARCGNSAATEPQPYDSCIVYRITRTNDDFAATVVTEISTDITTYGNSWGVDVNERTIGMIGYCNGNYQVMTDNPLRLFKWALPARDDLIDNATLTLSQADCVASCAVDYAKLQAMTCHGGDFLATMEDGSNCIWRLNCDEPRLLSRIPLVSGSEPEGVAVHDGALYVSQVRLDASDPLTIYKVMV